MLQNMLQTMPVLQSMRTPGTSSGGSKDAPERIFVGGLPPNVSSDSLKEHFEQFGEVNRVDLKFREDGNCKGFGFVLFKDIDVVEMILSEFSTHLFDDRQITCQRSKKPGEEGEKGDPNSRVFVGGLARGTTDQELETYFSQFGKLRNVDLKTGYAFVTFQDQAIAQRLATEGGHHSVGGKEVTCRVANARGSEPPPKKPEEPKALEDKSGWQDKSAWQDKGWQDKSGDKSGWQDKGWQEKSGWQENSGWQDKIDQAQQSSGTGSVPAAGLQMNAQMLALQAAIQTGCGAGVAGAMGGMGLAQPAAATAAEALLGSPQMGAAQVSQALPMGMGQFDMAQLAQFAAMQQRYGAQVTQGESARFGPY